MSDSRPKLTPRMIALGILPLIIAALIVIARRPDKTVADAPATAATKAADDGTQSGALAFEPIEPPQPNWTQ